MYGDGEQTRDFVYVDDVVQANMRAMFAPYPGPSPLKRGAGQPHDPERPSPHC
jgi:nucleoside-diphosphate-sugar epimerase